MKVPIGQVAMILASEIMNEELGSCYHLNKENRHWNFQYFMECPRILMESPPFWSCYSRKHYVISLWLIVFSWEHRSPVAQFWILKKTHHGTTLRLCGVELLRDAQTLGTLPRTEGCFRRRQRRRLLWKLGKVKQKTTKNGRNLVIFFRGSVFFFVVFVLVFVDLRCKIGKEM